ncbi:hypothetical protein Tco_0128135 [Tanacetum coccineum]
MVISSPSNVVRGKEVKEIFSTILKHWKDRFFLIDRHAIPDAMPWRHQDSSVADLAPTGVRAEDIRRLYENVIDLRPVHPAMLYAVGLTTIWKHVGHHPVFKDGEGMVATSMSQFLKFLVAKGVRFGKGTNLTANEAIPQHTTVPLPSGTQIPEKSDHQKSSWEESCHRRHFPTNKEEENNPPKADGSNRSGSGTHHSALPLNTIIPNKAKLTTRGDGLILESVTRTKDDTKHHLDNDPYHTRDETTHTRASGSTGRASSSSGGSHRQAFPRRNPSGSGIGSFLPLLSYFILLFNVGRGALAQIDILRRYEALNEDYGELYESHRSCQGVSDRLIETRNQLLDTADLTEKLAAMEKERDDLLDKDREREEHIKQLEADLASKTSSLPEAEGAVSTLKGDLERLTVDLSHAEIVRHNYVRQLLPTVFQRLLSSDEYKKSMSDVFNLAIATGWSKDVKAACSKEEAEAFLATSADYDPACKTTFMSEFDSLFNKSYPYVEKLAESFRLPLGDLQNMCPKGTGPTLSGNAADMQYHWLLDSSETACVASRVLYVTWSLALGLIQSGLHFGYYTSLGHCLLDSSGASCVPGIVHHLAIGSWTHPERLAFRVMRSMFRRNSSSFSSSLIIKVRCVGIPISAGITASLLYVRLKGVSPLLCFKEVRVTLFLT